MSPVIKRPDLPPVIAGTAGHVDHGKTSLVRLLTGCETDKLKEEKERGMSINLGFAPCLLPGNRVVGIIDVPGHIDFIRNMVAGAASIDILILVIAADDGIMPQTLEHMQIIKLLRSPRLMVALTKTDLVDATALESVKDEISVFLNEHGYGGSPIIPVSNVTFDGIDQIRSTLDGMVSSVMRETDSRAFRMNIERVFSVKGFGTVVSGIPLSGKINIGENVELLPSGKKSSVKSIQNYKHNTDNTYASVCSAINLKDIPAEEISRGMVIAAPGYFRPAKFAIIDLMNISRDFPIKHNSEFKFHAGTSEVNTKVSLIDKTLIEPGASAIVKIKFEEEVMIAPGDRFVLRRLSPSTTIGGGNVVAGYSMPIKTSRETLISAAEHARNKRFFETAAMCAPDCLLEHDEAVRLTGLVAQTADKLLNDKITSGFLADLGGGTFLVLPRLGELKDKILKGLALFHKNQKQLSGMDTETFCSSFCIRPANFTKLIQILVSSSDSGIKITNDKVALKTFVPAANTRIMQLKDKLLQLVEKSGINCVAQATVLESGAINPEELKSIIRMLVDEKLIVVIGNHMISARTFEECRRKITEIVSNKGLLEITDFRNATGASRNMSVDILEKFDGIGFTKRLPKGRVLMKK